MTEPLRYPDRVGSKFREDWIQLDVFERDGKLHTIFNHPDLGYAPHESLMLIQEQKANFAQDGIHFYPDDLAIPGGQKLHNLVRITREGAGIPKVDPYGPKPKPIMLTQHGMVGFSQEIFRYARKNSLSALENQLKTIMATKDYNGYNKKDLDTIYRDAWLQVSRAITALGQGPNSLVDSNNTVSNQHKEFLRKYIYAKALMKLEAPPEETKRKDDFSFQEKEPMYHLLPWPAQPLLFGSNQEGNFWGMSANEIVQELYLDSHWLVNMPGRAGQQRFIPKNIPFGYATEMDSANIEHYLRLWNEFGLETKVGTYEKYLQTIKKDTGSNIQIYVDVSRTGGGISYFARNRNDGSVDEIADTLMTWQEFGDFIAMEAKFSFLKDLGEWWKQQDEWFEDIPMLELTNLPGNWMQKSRIMKLIDVYKSDEDKIFKQGGFKNFRHSRSFTSSSDHIDEGSMGSLFLNKFGTNRDGSENMDELASWWLLSPVLRGLVSTAKWFGLSPEEWRNEINWAQAYFGGKTEIGQMGREVGFDFIKSIHKEFPDLTKMTEEDFDRIRNQEMQKYVLTRADYFDRVRSKSTLFGKWAGDIADSYRRETYTEKTGTGKRPNPNRTAKPVD